MIINKINNIQLNCELEDILRELRSQLSANGSVYLQKEPKRSGDHIMIQCVYHADGQERRPSAGIRESDGLYHCFTCGEVHSLPEVISHCFGYNDITGKEGLKWLLKNFATVQVEERKDVNLDYMRNGGISNSSHRIPDNRHYIGERELDSYRYTHPYMYERGLTDVIIEYFDVGFDKDTDTITFPVRDISGRCLFVARRSIRYKFYQFPKGVEKPLYGLYELIGWYKPFGTPPEVIVCEGIFDALSCWVYGRPAVALCGLGTELQFKQLRELSCRKLILATDNDEAGMKARKKLREKVQNKIITEFILPEGKKDINELTEDEFRNILEIF